MSYKKENVRSVKILLPNDNVSIPNFASAPASGTATSVTANKLNDSTASFTDTVVVGDVVYNTVSGALTTVTAIDSDTVLTLAADIFTSTDGYSIHRATSKMRGVMLYVGVAGDVAIETTSGDDVIIKNAAVGWHPVSIEKLKSTGTVATDFLIGY